MLRSMTAYVNKSFNTTYGLLTIEIQSLNRKFLEVYTQLDSIFFSLELDVKKKLSEKIHRGKVNIRISIQWNEENNQTLFPNLKLAKELKIGWEQLAKEFGIQEGFNLSLLKGEENLFIKEESKEINIELLKIEVMNCFSDSLDELINLKLSEGEHLFKDINKRILFIENCINKINDLTKLDESLHRQRLLNKINALIENQAENEERVMREICIIADKVDITEELVRLNAHINQFKNYFMEESLSIGKKLEFLLMEMMRESNTIASKTTNLEAIHLVIEVKTELEKIKEQLQNID